MNLSALNRVRVFLEVARLQSFVAAGKALGLTGPAVSKQVLALEDELGVRLLHRTTRKVMLTDEGGVFYERARLALEELDVAAGEARELRAVPKGTLKLNVPLSFGHMHLLPMLAGFSKKYPAVKLDVSFDDRIVDVIGEGFDLVIRIGVTPDSSLVVRTLADCPIIPVASPALVRAHGLPKTPAVLKGLPMIAYANQGAVGEWRYRDRHGKQGALKIEGVLRTNTAEMMREAALAGLGVAVLPEFMVANYLKAGKLVQLLPDYETYPARQVVALMPPNRHRTAKVSLFLEWLVAACAAMPLTQAS